MWYKKSKKYNTAIVALWFKPKDIKNIKIDHNFKKREVTENKDFHITLMYLGELKDIEDKKSSIEDILENISQKYKDFTINIGGVAKFFSDKETPIVFTINSVEIEKIRFDLLQGMNSIGIKDSATFGFVPHMTLAFTEDADIDLKDIDITNNELPVTGVCLSWGGNLKHFKFK